MRPVLSHGALPPGEEVGAEQAVEINQDHNIHHNDGDEKVSAVVQPGVVLDDVPGEVELGAQAKRDVGGDVGELVVVVRGGGLSARQLQHQPQVQGDAVHLYKESYDSTGYIQLSVEGVQETPDHLKRRQTERQKCFLQLASCDLWSHCLLVFFLFLLKCFVSLLRKVLHK